MTRQQQYDYLAAGDDGTETFATEEQYNQWLARRHT